MNNDVFNFLRKNEILIGAWVSPPPRNTIENKETFINEKQYQFLKESGINTIYALYERGDQLLDEVTSALNLAERFDVNYLVRDERLKQVQSVTDYNKLVDTYKNKKAFSGFLYWDEPGMIDFPSIRNVFQIARKSSNPDKLVYVNLLPQYATNSQLFFGVLEKEKNNQIIDPRKYYEDFVQKTNSTYISYDFYPFEGEFPKIKEGFYQQYSLVNDIAIKYNLINMCFIQLCSFNQHSRNPSDIEIRFHVNVSLAYNTLGIQYFTYFLPVNGEVENFVGCMINHAGEKTPKFECVKKLNNFIKLIQEEITLARWEGIVTEDVKEVPVSDRIILKSICISGKNLLTGVYGSEHSKLLLIVNTSLTNTQEVTIQVNNPKDIVVFNQKDLTKKQDKIIKPLKFILQPGEARMIKIYNA
ncbi:hypothetical protein ACAG96_07010 [Candidatus Izemoplasma sp. B36]|uniref:hypothetical protein n=1 Tax=Candidatus Izemoplasma sp. B36 TaxID=3242468 RepID=UPI00355763E7